MADLPDVNQRFVADVSGYVRDVNRGADSADKFGDRNSAAALAARRMGVAAKDAADKAARSQRQAAEAAEKLAREEISVEKAAAAAARAEHDLERADIAQAAAARAAAKANEDLADEQRQAARAAELAAAKMRLASLAAAGSVEEHDHLVRQLRARFPDLGKDGVKAFEEIGASASKTSTLLAKSGPVGIAAIAVGLGSLPVLANLAAGAVTFGLGGALIGIGVVSAAQSKRVQKDWTALGKHVKTEALSWGKPFEKTLTQTADFFENTFDDLAPTLKESLADLAPVTTEFADDFSRALTKLEPAIEDVTDAAGPLIREVGQKLPGLMDRTADSISQVAKAADPEMLGRFVDGLGLVVVAAGDATYVLSKLSGVVSLVGPISVGAERADDLARALRNVTSGADIGSTALEAYERAVTSFQLGSGLARTGLGLLGSTTATTTAQIASMKNTMQLASQTAAQLKASLDALSGKTLTARAAARDYQQAVDDATASIKENGRTLNINTQAGRNNQAALDNLAVKAHAQAVAFRESDMSAAQVARGMNEARAKFISTSVAMGDTRRHAIDLATKLFGVRDAANSIPRSKVTNVSERGTKATLSLIKQLLRQYGSIPNRIITDIITRHIESGTVQTGYGRQHHAEGGYIDGYAAGGLAGYPGGGMVRGAGTGTSDSIPAMLSAGEFVVNAAATARNRALLEMLNRQSGRAPAAVAPAALTPRGGDGATQIVNVNVFVQGSVVSERKLVEAVRQGLAGGSVLNPGRNGTLVPRTI